MAFNHVEKIQDAVPIRNVIVSVYDKSGLENMLVALLRYCPGVRFYATGGTYSFIQQLLGERSGAHLVDMTRYTGQPEMKGGLVKTLDWKIYLGLLAEPFDREHEADLARYDAVQFDMVICNLYPFTQASDQADSFETARQHIDIGGPTLLRAAAKNFLRVCPVPSPEYYAQIMQALEKNNGRLTLKDRINMAEAVFERQSMYDTAIADYLRTQKENVAKTYTIV
ncbi:MAG TPA: hypothetical protein PK074_05225 [Spirochaetales bacterium]|nr:hypothetical protein [Spirochaetales bacterium]HQK34104.1 hypothetical protein [Spirochaetales bacterium]